MKKELTFAVGEAVWVKRVGRKGIVKHVEGDGVIVTYFDKKGIRRIRTCHKDQLDSFSTKKKAKMKDDALTIKIKYFADIVHIEKISKGDWIDLRAAETVELKAGEFKLIGLGVGMKLPEGYEAVVVPRSSTFKTWGILQTNSQGVIDNSYSGDKDEWKFPAYATRDIIIEKNDRICQFRIQKKMEKVNFEVVEKLDDKSRGGFGTTGKN